MGPVKIEGVSCGWLGVELAILAEVFLILPEIDNVSQSFGSDLIGRVETFQTFFCVLDSLLDDIRWVLTHHQTFFVFQVEFELVVGEDSPARLHLPLHKFDEGEEVRDAKKVGLDDLFGRVRLGRVLFLPFSVVRLVDLVWAHRREDRVVECKYVGLLIENKCVQLFDLVR